MGKYFNERDQNRIEKLVALEAKANAAYNAAINNGAIATAVHWGKRVTRLSRMMTLNVQPYRDD